MKTINRFRIYYEIGLFHLITQQDYVIKLKELKAQANDSNSIKLFRFLSYSPPTIEQPVRSVLSICWLGTGPNNEQDYPIKGDLFLSESELSSESSWMIMQENGNLFKRNTFSELLNEIPYISFLLVRDNVEFKVLPKSNILRLIANQTSFSNTIGAADVATAAAAADVNTDATAATVATAASASASAAGIHRLHKKTILKKEFVQKKKKDGTLNIGKIKLDLVQFPNGYEILNSSNIDLSTIHLEISMTEEEYNDQANWI
jgi:hypothetical protein